MIRIEIKTVIERRLSGRLSVRARRKMLAQEIERAAADPIAYQQSNMGGVKIVGSLLKGPFASTSIEKNLTDQASAPDATFPHMLEPPGFPAL